MMSPAGIVIVAVFVPLIVYSVYSVITDRKKKKLEEAQKGQEIVFVHGESDELSKSA